MVTDVEVLPPSGRQIEIRSGEYRAVVATVGAAVREYARGDRDVFVGFAEDEAAPAFHGAVLAPWPNRLADGRYEFGGRAHQLAISEPDRATALHGLLCWVHWEVREHSADRVELGTRLAAQPGYPFTLDMRVEYALSSSGLAVTLTATNRSAETAPYGAGFHPWLSPGAGSVDDCVLTVGAAGHVDVDDRLLPTGEHPVDAGDGAFDYRSPRTLEGVELDDAFIDPVRDDAGLSWSSLTGGDGRTVRVWMDDSLDSWQVCTGDAVDAPRRREGVAVEPQTCAPNSFVNGTRVVRIAPGASCAVRWGADLV